MKSTIKEVFEMTVVWIPCSQNFAFSLGQKYSFITIWQNYRHLILLCSLMKYQNFYIGNNHKGWFFQWENENEKTKDPTSLCICLCICTMIQGLLYFQWYKSIRWYSMTSKYNAKNWWIDRADDAVFCHLSMYHCI